MFGNGKVWLCVHKRAVIVESHFKRRITLYNIFFGADATSLQVGNVWGVAIKVAMYDVCKTIMRSFSYRGCLCMLAHLTYIFPAKKKPPTRPTMFVSECTTQSLTFFGHLRTNRGEIVQLFFVF